MPSPLGQTAEALPWGGRRQAQHARRAAIVYDDAMPDFDPHRLEVHASAHRAILPSRQGRPLVHRFDVPSAQPCYALEATNVRTGERIAVSAGCGASDPAPRRRTTLEPFDLQVLLASCPVPPRGLMREWCGTQAALCGADDEIACGAELQCPTPARSLRPSLSHAFEAGARELTALASLFTSSGLGALIGLMCLLFCYVLIHGLVRDYRSWRASRKRR